MANGNSRAARSARAKKQLRDKKGRWIEMGRSRLSWYSSKEKKNLSGTAIESSKNLKDVIVQTDDGKRHAVSTRKVEVIDHKFTLPTKSDDKGRTQSQTPERGTETPSRDSSPAERRTEAPRQSEQAPEPRKEAPTQRNEDSPKQEEPITEVPEYLDDQVLVNEAGSHQSPYENGDKNANQTHYKRTGGSAYSVAEIDNYNDTEEVRDTYAPVVNSDGEVLGKGVRIFDKNTGNVVKQNSLDRTGNLKQMTGFDPKQTPKPGEQPKREWQLDELTNEAPEDQKWDTESELDLSNATSAEDVNEALRKKFPNLEVDLSAMDDLENVKKAAKAFDDNVRRYPHLSKVLGKFQASKRLRNASAWVEHYPLEHMKQPVMLSIRADETERSIGALYDGSGYMSVADYKSSDNGYDPLMNHEFGHINEEYANVMNQGEYSQSKVADEFDAYLDTLNPSMTKKARGMSALSEYGMTNPAETIAESFAERVEYGDDARPFSKFVTGVMSKWIPELKDVFGESKSLPELVRERDNANIAKNKDYIRPEEMTDAVLDGLPDGAFLEHGRQAWLKKDSKWFGGSDKPLTSKNVRSTWSGSKLPVARFTLDGKDSEGHKNRSIYVDQETLKDLQPGDKIITGYTDFEVTNDGRFMSISDDVDRPAREAYADEVIQNMTVAMTDGEEVRVDRASRSEETSPEPEVEDTTPVSEPEAEAPQTRPERNPAEVRRDLPGAELPEGWKPTAWGVGQPGTVEKETMPKLNAGRGRPPVHRTYYDANGNAMQQGQTVLNKDTGEYVTLGKSRTDTSTDYYDAEDNFMGVISTKKLESLSNTGRNPLENVNIADNTDPNDLEPNQINRDEMYAGYFRDTPVGAKLTTDTGLEYEYEGDDTWKTSDGGSKSSADVATQIMHDSNSKWFLDENVGSSGDDTTALPGFEAPEASNTERQRAEARYQALSDEVDQTPIGSPERDAWDSAIDIAMDTYNEDPSLEIYSKEWYDLIDSSYASALQDQKDNTDSSDDDEEAFPEVQEEPTVEEDEEEELSPERLEEIRRKVDEERQLSYEQGLGQRTVPRGNSAFSSVDDIKHSDAYDYTFTNDRGEKITPGLKLWDQDGNQVFLDEPIEKGQDHINTVNAEAYTDAVVEIMGDPNLTQDEKAQKFADTDLDSFKVRKNLNDLSTTPPADKRWDTDNPIDLSSANTLDDIKSVMSQKYPGMFVVLDEGDVNDAKLAVQAFDENLRRFPFLARAVDRFEGSADSNSDTEAHVGFHPSIFGDGAASFNINLGHTAESYRQEKEKNSTRNWTISNQEMDNDNPYQSVIDHETGHLLEYYAKFANPDYNQSKVLDKVDEYLNTFSYGDKGSTALKKGLSEYGATSGAEALAESVAEKTIKGEDSRPLADVMVGAMSEFLPELNTAYGNLKTADQVIQERKDAVNSVDKALLPGSDFSEEYVENLPAGTAIVSDRGFTYLKQDDGTWKSAMRSEPMSSKDISRGIGTNTKFSENMGQNNDQFVNKGLFDGLEVGDKLTVGQNEYTYEGNDFGAQKWSNPGGKIVNPELVYVQLRDDPNATVTKARLPEIEESETEAPEVPETPLDTTPEDEVTSADVDETKVPGTGIDRTEPTTLEGEKYPPTRQQQDVIDAVMEGEDVLVQAKAGAGKTSTLEAISRRIAQFRNNEQILYIAFNKSVQKEAKGRMPGNVEARTGHSLAYQWAPAWMQERMGGGKGPGGKARGKKRQQEALRRPDDIADHLEINDIQVPGEDPMEREEVAMAAVRTVDRYAYSAEDEIGPEHLPDSLQHMPQEVQDEILDAARRAWADLSSEDGQLKFTFDHSRKHWALTRPDLANPEGNYVTPAKVLFLDEAQDTPPVLAKIVADQNIQKVIVGDADQAIYGFTGAVDFLSNAEADVELPLNKSWRFGPAVADAGNRFLQLLGSKGRVVGGGPESTITPDGERMSGADAILTRSNAGMIGEIAKELEAGRTVGVPTGTKADMQRLFKHADDLMNGRTPKNIHEDLASFRTWKDFMKEVEKDEDPKVKMINKLIEDYGGVEPILRLIDQVIDPAETGGDNDGDNWKGAKVDPTTGAVSNAYMFNEGLKRAGGAMYNAGYRWNKADKTWVPRNSTPEGIEKAKADLEAEVDRVFGAPTKPDVTISTAHKAKGLEWGRVRIGDDFQEPKEDENTGKILMPADEELRLAYVAVTRAESELDPGSLRWVYGMTDDDGGIPESDDSNSNDPVVNPPEDDSPAPEQIEDESDVDVSPDTEDEIDVEELEEEPISVEELEGETPEVSDDPLEETDTTKSAYDFVAEDFQNASDGTALYGDDSEAIAIKRDGKWYTPSGREVTDKYMLDSLGMFQEGTLKTGDTDFPTKEAKPEAAEPYSPGHLPPEVDALGAGLIDKDDPDLAVKLDNVPMEAIVRSPETNNRYFIYRKNKDGMWEVAQIMQGARNRPFNKEDYDARTSEQFAEAIVNSDGNHYLGLPAQQRQEETTPEPEEVAPEPEPTAPTPDVVPESQDEETTPEPVEEVPSEPERMEVRTVEDLKAIRMDKNLDEEYVEQLTEQFRRDGIGDNYVIVEETETDDILTDGHHMLEAVERAGITEVPARVFDNSPEGRQAATRAIVELERLKEDGSSRLNEPEPSEEVTPDPEPEVAPESETPSAPEPKTYRIPSNRINEGTLDLVEDGGGAYNDKNQALAWKRNGKWKTRKGTEVTPKQIVDVMKQGENGIFVFNDPNAPNDSTPTAPSGNTGRSNSGGTSTPGSTTPKATGQPGTVSKQTIPSTGRGRPSVARTYFDDNGNGYGKNDYVRDTRNGKELRVLHGVTDGSVRVFDSEKDSERTIQTKHLEFLRQGENDDNIDPAPNNGLVEPEPASDVPDVPRGRVLVGEDGQGRYFTDTSGKKIYYDQEVTFTKKGQTFTGKVGYIAPNGTIKVYLAPDYTSYRQIQAHRLKGTN